MNIEMEKAVVILGYFAAWQMNGSVATMVMWAEGASVEIE